MAAHDQRRRAAFVHPDAFAVRRVQSAMRPSPLRTIRYRPRLSTRLTLRWIPGFSISVCRLRRKPAHHPCLRRPAPCRLRWPPPPLIMMPVWMRHTCLPVARSRRIKLPLPAAPIYRILGQCRLQHLCLDIADIAMPAHIEFGGLLEIDQLCRAVALYASPVGYGFIRGSTAAQPSTMPASSRLPGALSAESCPGICRTDSTHIHLAAPKGIELHLDQIAIHALRIDLFIGQLV